MRNIARFYWLCTKAAARGCTPSANDWQWLLGFPALAALIWLANRRWGEGTVSLPQDTAIGALVAAGAAFFITWIFTFIARFIRAPVDLFHAEKYRADAAIKWLDDFTQPKRDTWYLDAVFYVANKRWPEAGERVLDDRLSTETPQAHIGSLKSRPEWAAAEKALAEMHQAAGDGRLAVWAKPNTRAVLRMDGTLEKEVLWEPVETSHWKTHRVYPNELLFAPQHVYTSTRVGGWDSVSCCALRVCKGQVERLWTPENAAIA
jgi:hypothetical protein